MEQSSSGNWHSGTPTVAWVQSYTSASPATYICSLATPGFLADHGDDVLGGTGSADGWTVSQVYRASSGIPVAGALPEVYYSGMAPEWQALSERGGPEHLHRRDRLHRGHDRGGLGQLQPGRGLAAAGEQHLRVASHRRPHRDRHLAPGPAAARDRGSAQLGPCSRGHPGDHQRGQPAGRHPGLLVVQPGHRLPGAERGAITATVPPGSPGFVDVQVAGMGRVPATGAAGVLINLTVTDTTAESYVTAFPAGVAVPLTSSIDFQPQDTRANPVEVALGRGGRISIYNKGGPPRGWWTWRGGTTPDSRPPRPGCTTHSPGPHLRHPPREQ